MEVISSLKGFIQMIIKNPDMNLYTKPWSVNNFKIMPETFISMSLTNLESYFFEIFIFKLSKSFQYMMKKHYRIAGFKNKCITG